MVSPHDNRTKSNRNQLWSVWKQEIWTRQRQTCHSRAILTLAKSSNRTSLSIVSTNALKSYSSSHLHQEVSEASTEARAATSWTLRRHTQVCSSKSHRQWLIWHLCWRTQARIKVHPRWLNSPTTLTIKQWLQASTATVELRPMSYSSMQAVQIFSHLQSSRLVRSINCWLRCLKVNCRNHNIRSTGHKESIQRETAFQTVVCLTRIRIA